MMHKTTCFLLLLGCALLSASCGGEITFLDFGSAQEESFERYRDEIQPIMEYDASGPVDGVFVLRNCSIEGGCHGPELGAGSLVIIPNPNEEDLNTNHQQVLSKINRDDPASSILLTDPLIGNPEHPVASFTGEDDCCYLKVLTWIAEEPSPECVCITE